jgi:hypothetical protein
MIVLTLGETSEEIICTLTERRTLTGGYYLFVFTNVTTRGIVNKIYAVTEDTSAYPDRFNSFDIDTDTVFTGQSTGEWRYEVYEQNSSNNTTVTNLTRLESGIMLLKPASDFTFTEYSGTTTFKQYGG